MKIHLVTRTSVEAIWIYQYLEGADILIYKSMFVRPFILKGLLNFCYIKLCKR